MYSPSKECCQKLHVTIHRADGDARAVVERSVAERMYDKVALHFLPSEEKEDCHRLIHRHPSFLSRQPSEQVLSPQPATVVTLTNNTGKIGQVPERFH